MFKVTVHKYSNEAFLAPNLGIFFLARIFLLSEFQGVDFTYDKSVFKIQSKNNQNQIF